MGCYYPPKTFLILKLQTRYEIIQIVYAYYSILNTTYNEAVIYGTCGYNDKFQVLLNINLCLKVFSFNPQMLRLRPKKLF